ncbi:hypothetical protein ACIPUC_31805 [Streptomyces sp. LARHCF249]
MSEPTATPPDTGTPTAPQPPSPTSSPGRAVTLLLALVLGLLILVIGAMLLYVTAVHPRLATPLTVAVAGIALVVTVAGIIVASHRQ